MRNFTETATVNEKYTVVIDFLTENGETALAEFIADRQAKAQKKSAVKVKPEDETIKGEVVAYLGTVSGDTATNIFKHTSASSVQKVNAMLKKLIECGKVVKTSDKKIVTFALVVGE